MSARLPGMWWSSSTDNTGQIPEDHKEENMGGKRTILVCLVCMFLLLTGQSVPAATGGGAEPTRDGQTDVMAGVAVDYMGKLQFLALDRDTGDPIPGASVEIYIPSLDRYVLFGVTDANGILELDVAFGDRVGQYTETGGQTVFNGITLYLKDRNISYRVYKAGWLPYPFDGTVELHTREVPQVVTVHLYKEKKDNGGSSGGGGGNSGGGSPIIEAFPIGDLNPPLAQIQIPEEQVPAGGIPKTGVEGTMQYWIAGLFFFLIAGGILMFLLKNEKETDERAQKR